MTELVLLATGRDADVFALDTQRVLRRYRDEGDVAAEAAVMAYVGGLGFPVPQVYSAGGGDLVLERLTGPTMLEALGAGEITAVAAADLLAGLHDRLHALAPQMPHEPGDRPLHLDLHPANVMLEARGPVVIDWRNSGQGPPEFDVAVSALIVAQVAVDSAREEAALAETFLTAFLAGVGAMPSEALDHAVRFRRADPNLTAREIGLLGEAVSLIG
ncbi:phosphotransferase [Streptacidiphilus sp. P02-A3a]|uniref:phosphotransferase n=1 Tax=Streptacidiphilus sp. P02-A3a TaxID=2704468 RepID=UPI0015F81581|nr:phosphotransferase [Streptacidiphilus sp. P02-A3a]QMU70226.1 phosphotransferase [Streptacidiphilus sp. P02-A3a]QMU70318.1 phosphotransferase [Streptacidiphilus sp. P02-A3a]